MTHFRITVFLDSGTEQVTEEAFDGTVEDFEDELVERIEDRENAWKSIGHLTIRFNHIDGFAIEEITKEAA